MPLALSDEQLSAIMGAAMPVAPADRAAFLEAVAAALGGLAQRGRGLLRQALAPTP
jgi:hypothetical protein